MDGLIEQAKSKLWEIVNTISTLKSREESPELEISLYEYGNDWLSPHDNYIRQVTGFTTDLDKISEKLFSLRTNGGSEYCGAVIYKSLDQLEWQYSAAEFKLIFIAGNEPFNQGPISYVESISKARSKGVVVNTIFCGDYREGVNTNWLDGSRLGDGKYFCINSDERVVYIQTPYDACIDGLNIQLNNTYIGYGSHYEVHKSNQLQQDINAESISKANKTDRAVSKSSKVYNNASWDLVDKAEEDKTILSKVKDSELPEELRRLDKSKRAEYIDQKSKERKAIQDEISRLAVKREKYIQVERLKDKNSKDDFGTAVKKTIMELAIKKGYM